MKYGVDCIGVSAGALIFDNRGNLFLSKRSQSTKNEKGCWENPGGSVDFGETLEQAVRREIKEEYGVEIEIIEQFPAADHIIIQDRQHWVATTFLAKIKRGHIPKILEPEKCDAIGWFQMNKLPKPLSLITQIDILYYKKTRKKNKL